MTLYTIRARERAAAGRRERAAAMLRANLAAVTQAIKALALRHARELARYCAGLEAQPERWMHALTIVVMKALGYKQALGGVVMYGYALWEAILIAYDLYANKCTKQYEKFTYYADKVPFTWADCKAAYDIIMSITPGKERWYVLHDWKNGQYPPDYYDPWKQVLEAL